jgi:hypothetical protein
MISVWLFPAMVMFPAGAVERVLPAQAQFVLVRFFQPLRAAATWSMAAAAPIINDRHDHPCGP